MKSTPKKLRVAVIGVGYLGSFHTEKYASLPSADLIGVIDIQEDRAKALAGKFKTSAYADYRQILDKVDAVSVAVPTDGHYQIVKDCLEAGVDVLVEKPFTEKVWQAERLISLAEEHNRILQVGHLERFNTAIQRSRKLLTHPFFIECHRLNMFVGRGTEVDVVLDLMIHDLDLLLSFVPSKVSHIDAVGTPVLSKTIDIANVRLQFENGCVANLTASRISMKPMRKMRIFQPDAYLSIDFQEANIDVCKKMEQEIHAERLSLSKGDSLAEEIKVFVSAVRQRMSVVDSTACAYEALSLADRIVKKIKGRQSKYLRINPGVHEGA